MPDRPSAIVELTHHATASPSSVFAVLTDAEAVGACCPPLTHVRIDPKSGGRIQFSDPDFGPVIGRVGEFEPGVRLSYRFVQNWPSVLSFDLFDDAGGSRIDLILSGFGGLRQDRPDLDATFAQRWETWLACLLKRA